jgi:hypothetical protein
MTAVIDDSTGLIVPQWQAPRNVRALVTTRAGGLSAGPYRSMNLGARSGDDRGTVAANRAILRRLLPSEPAWINQAHGTVVADADLGLPDAEADASVARRLNVVCAVLVADCLPVLLADTSGRVVAAVHAGWRGLCAGVIEQTVEAMRVPPATLVAWLGPCIGAAVYEVGDEVRRAFCAADANAAAAFAARPNAKWLADLPLLARQRLARAGVSEVTGGGDCTFSDPRRFYSFRRDGTTGRMAAFIWRAGDAGPAAHLDNRDQ